MNLQTCLKKLELVQVLNFATVDGDGDPQVRNISAIHYEPDAPDEIKEQSILINGEIREVLNVLA